MAAGFFFRKVDGVNTNKKNKLMKPTITLLAITVLAAFALVGCNQNTPGNSTDAQSTNSSMTDTNATTGGITNMPATNSLHEMETNVPASTNQLSAGILPQK
jgi:hypothetical protein